MLFDWQQEEPATRVQVQVPGSGWRLPAEVLRQEYRDNVAFRTLLLQYRWAFEMMISQDILCNTLHMAEERLSRWLLMVQDRLQSDELELTHEFLATMLGTRRATVTLTAGALREAELIEYRRGHITILDRAGLEQRACECYGAVTKSFLQLPYLAEWRV